MRAWQLALMAGGLLLSAAATAAAQDSGLSGLHQKVRVGGKLCMYDHYHSASSNGQSSRKAAEVAAIRSWQDFTAWEYGGAWGSFAMAEGKKVSCFGSGSSFNCDVDARPCRRR